MGEWDPTQASVKQEFETWLQTCGQLANVYHLDDGAVYVLDTQKSSQ